MESLSLEEGSGLQVLRQVSQKYSGRKLPSWDVLSKEFALQTLDTTAPDKVSKYRVEMLSPDLQQEGHRHGQATRQGFLKWERGAPEEPNVRGQIPEWRKPTDGIWDRNNMWPEIRTPYHSMAVLSHEFVDAETHFDHAFHHSVVLCVWGGDTHNKDDANFLGSAVVSLDSLEWEFRKHATPQWRAIKRFSGVGLERHGVRRDGLSVSGSIEVSLVRGEAEKLSHLGRNSFAETWQHVIACAVMMALSGVVSAMFDSLMMLGSSDELIQLWWPVANMFVMPTVLFAGYACDKVSYIHAQGDDDEEPEDSEHRLCAFPTLQHTCSLGWFFGLGTGFWVQIALHVPSAVVPCGMLMTLCVATQQGLCLLSATMMLQDLLGTAARRGVSKWQAFAFGYVFYYLARIMTLKMVDWIAADSCTGSALMSESRSVEAALNQCTQAVNAVSWAVAVTCLLGFVGSRTIHRTEQWRSAELTKLANMHVDDKKKRKQRQAKTATSLTLTSKHHVLARGFSPETGEWAGADLLRCMKLDKPSHFGQEPGYLKRCLVEDERASWDVPWASYAPFGMDIPHGYCTQKEGSAADNDDAMAVENLGSRFSFEGEIILDPKTNRPRNPRGRTGIQGRGTLCSCVPSSALLSSPLHVCGLN